MDFQSILSMINQNYGILSLLFEILIGIISLIIEHKFKLINRLLKYWSKFRNKPVEAKIYLEYKTESDFKQIVESFKNSFRNEKDFKVLSDGTAKMEFAYDIYLIKLISNQEYNLSIEVSRMGCGIRDMKSKVNDFLIKLDGLKNNKNDKVLTEFITSEISLSLPYRWENLDLTKSKNFVLKGYSIKLEDNRYKSEVEISLDSVNVKTNIQTAIIPVLEKFL